MKNRTNVRLTEVNEMNKFLFELVVQLYRGLKPIGIPQRAIESLRVVQFYRGLKLPF